MNLSLTKFPSVLIPSVHQPSRFQWAQGHSHDCNPCGLSRMSFQCNILQRTTTEHIIDLSKLLFLLLSIFFISSFSCFFLPNWAGLKGSESWHKPRWFLTQQFEEMLVLGHDHQDLHCKLSQQFVATLTSLSTFTLRFCQGKASDSLIISPHLQMYFKFASDKTARNGINTWQINLINNQGD